MLPVTSPPHATQGFCDHACSLLQNPHIILFAHCLEILILITKTHFSSLSLSIYISFSLSSLSLSSLSILSLSILSLYPLSLLSLSPSLPLLSLSPLSLSPSPSLPLPLSL